MLCATVATAHDFEVDGIYYNITSSADQTVEVTYKGTSYSQYSGEYSGTVIITESVAYNGTTYSVASIGKYSFADCYGLKNISIPNSVTSIEDYAFCNSGLTSVIIPNSVTYIGKNAFDGCSNITTLTISNSITDIKPYTFYNCRNLTKVTIPDGVTNIGDYAFCGCSSLTSVEIPNSVTSIGRSAFVYCRKLTSIEIPNNVTSIGANAFYGTGWYNNQPDGVVYIGKSILYRYKGIMPENTTITVNEGTLYIADDAFNGCSGLTSIVIPNSVISIGASVFWDCTGLTNVEIPNSVTSIGAYVFYGCTSIISVTIGNSVANIGIYMFYNTPKLTSIISQIPANKLFEISSYVFQQVVDKEICTLYVPYGAKETYASTAGWSEFANIVEFEPTVTEVTIVINQYGAATYCLPYALDFSNVEGIKAYSAIGFNSGTQVVTLAKVMTTPAEAGIFVKGEPGEYVVPIIEECNEHTLNLLVGTLEQTTVNSTDGEMSNYRFTITEGDEAPMFYPFEDNTTFSAGKAYLQIPTAWLPATAQKSVSIRFDEGETTDIDEVNDELKGESGKVKTIYDLSGHVVENPTSGIYIVDGKKVLVK